jgi:hypothetical protein
MNWGFGSHFLNSRHCLVRRPKQEKITNESKVVQQYRFDFWGAGCSARQVHKTVSTMRLNLLMQCWTSPFGLFVGTSPGLCIGSIPVHMYCMAWPECLKASILCHRFFWLLLSTFCTINHYSSRLFMGKWREPQVYFTQLQRMVAHVTYYSQAARRSVAYYNNHISFRILMYCLCSWLSWTNRIFLPSCSSMDSAYLRLVIVYQ